MAHLFLKQEENRISTVISSWESGSLLSRVRKEYSLGVAKLIA